MPWLSVCFHSLQILKTYDRCNAIGREGDFTVSCHLSKQLPTVLKHSCQYFSINGIEAQHQVKDIEIRNRKRRGHICRQVGETFTSNDTNLEDTQQEHSVDLIRSHARTCCFTVTRFWACVILTEVKFLFIKPALQDTQFSCFAIELDCKIIGYVPHGFTPTP